MNSRLLAIIALFAAALPCLAGIYTLNDFIRASSGASLTETFDFVPNEGWSGTPPNTTHWKNNGESMYLIGNGMGDVIVPLLTP